MTRVLTFDPGGTTGYACLNTESKEIAAGDFPHFSTVTILLEAFKPDIIVIEAFRLYPWKANAKTWSSFPEVEVIGAIKHECYRLGFDWVEQGADTKALFNDEKLKKLGLWKGFTAHGRDAIRHALYRVTTGGEYYWVNQL